MEHITKCRLNLAIDSNHGGEQNYLNLDTEWHLFILQHQPPLFKLAALIPSHSIDFLFQIN